MAWLSLTDAAEFYQCSTRTLRRYISKGTLTSKLSNGQRLVWFAEQVHTVSSQKPSIPKERYMIPLFEIFEGLCTLRMRFEGPLNMADFLEYASPPSSQEKTSDFNKNCRFFFEHLDECFRQVDKLLNTFDLDQSVLLTLYRTLVILKVHWQESGLYLHEEQVEERATDQSDTLAIFNHLLYQVRMLLLLCAPQSSTETESQSFVLQKGIVNVGLHPHAGTHEDLVSQSPMEEISPITGAKKKTSSKKGTKDDKSET